MKLLNKLFIVFCITFAINYYTKTIIQSFSLYIDGLKKVIVIGDCHANENTAQVLANQQKDISMFKESLNILSKYNQPVSFILEASDTKVYKVDMQNEPRGCLMQTGFIALNNNLKMGAINFNLADHRPDNYSLAYQFFSQILDLKNQYPGNIETDFLMLLQEIAIRTKLFESIYGFNPNTNDFIKEIDQLFIKFNSEKAVLKITNEAQKYLNGLQDFVVKDWTKTKNILLKYDPSTLVTKVLSDIVIKNDQDKITKTTFIKPECSALFVADIGYMLELAKSLQAYDNIIIYVGNSHVNRFHEFLTSLNFSRIIYKVIDQPVFSKASLFEDNQLPAILSKIFINFDAEKAISSSENISKYIIETFGNNTENNRCPFCSRVANKKCSKCKKISYCSVECQKAHWALHKINCNNN